MEWQIPDWLIIVTAWAMMATAFIYPFIRKKVLYWYEDLENLRPLNRQIAKTYGYYIQGLNFLFGLLTLLYIDEITNQTGLAVAMTGLIALYWVIRVIVQFAFYPANTLPRTSLVKYGTLALNSAITIFAFVYTWMFLWNVIP